MTGSQDLLERLRDASCDQAAFTPDHAKCICRLTNAAADELERLQERLAELVMHIDGIVKTSDGVNIKADTGMLKRHEDGTVPWSELTGSCWLGSLKRARDALNRN